MVVDGSPPAPDEYSLRDILTPDELKELLSPVGIGRDDSANCVLVLSEHPDDVATIVRYLDQHGIRVIPASHRYGALDLFRKRPYLAFVSTVTALGREPEETIGRLQAVDSEVRLGFIVEAADSDNGDSDTGRSDTGRSEVGDSSEFYSRSGTVVTRPLDDVALARLFRFLPVDLTPGRSPLNVSSERREGLGPADAGRKDQEQGDFAESAAAQQERAERSHEGVGSRQGGELSADPLVAVRCLLEARTEGSAGLTEGLRKWLAEDPTLQGLVTFGRGDGDTPWTLEARGREGDEPDHGMLREAVELFGMAPRKSVEARGRFWVFRGVGVDDGAVLGLWRGRGAPAEEPDDALTRALAPILGLLGPDVTGGPSGRARFLEIAETRWRACERHDGALAVLAVECAPSVEGPGQVSGDSLSARLRGLFRAGDWIVAHGPRVYGLLDPAGPGWSGAITTRLRRNFGTEELRVVGYGWRPMDPASPATLVEDVERRLDGSEGQPLLELTEFGDREYRE